MDLSKEYALAECECDFIAGNDAKVPHGYWIDRPLIKRVKRSNVPVVQCSICGLMFCDLINNHHTVYRNCPYCGAKMEDRS